MNKIKLLRSLSFLLLPLLLILVVTSCGEDEDPPAAPEPAFSWNPETIIAGESVTFVNETENAVSYQWNLGNGTTSTEETPTTSYSSAGDYNVVLIATGPGGTEQTSQTITIGEPRLFFIDLNDSAVYRADLAAGTATEAFETAGKGYGIDYDHNNDKIYYLDWDNTTLVQTNLDGSAEEVLASDILDAFSVKVDTMNSKLYLADRETSAIWTANLDGSGLEILYGPEDGLESPIDVALDPENGKIYVNDVGFSPDFLADGVWVGEMDGSSITKEITGGGYSIAVDTENDMLYYNDAFDGENIEMAPLNDLSNPTTFTSNLGYPRVYGLRVAYSKVYWTDLGAEVGDGRIYRADLDGENVEELVTDLADPRQFFIVK